MKHMPLDRDPRARVGDETLAICRQIAVARAVFKAATAGSWTVVS
jgi:hypothetical protein